MKKYLMTAVFTLICTVAFLVQAQYHETTIPDSIKSVEFYDNHTSGNLSDIFIDAIDSAEDSILLLIYSLTDQEIIEHLNRQSEKGITVKIVSDAKASPCLNSKLDHNADVTRRYGPGLMHQKILVIDTEKVWIGSANMSSESLTMHDNLVTAFHCQDLAKAIHNKADTLKIEGKSESIAKSSYIIGGQEIELWFLPDNPKAYLHLKELIRSAKKTIRIAMFTWTRYDLAKEVINAAKKGVQVEVVIDRHSGKGASSKIVNLLKQNDINVTLSTGTQLLHHKFLYIDNKLLAHGSANWTKAAFTQNDDCFIVMHDLTAGQNAQMEAIWQNIYTPQ